MPAIDSIAQNKQTAEEVFGTLVTQIWGPSGPAKHSQFPPLKGVPSHRDLTLSQCPVLTPCCLTVLFPEKEIHNWVAHLVQSGIAVQRAQGEFLAFLGAEMRPLLGDVPKGIRTARSASGHTVTMRECTVMMHPDTALSYRCTVMMPPSSSLRVLTLHPDATIIFMTCPDTVL
jgi:hypothetical protein